MKTVIEMAREAGLVGGPVYARGLERFAELARADEREECAKLADEVVEGKRWFNDLPAAIRARSNT